MASGPSLAPAEAPVKPVFLPTPAPPPSPGPGHPYYEGQRATRERQYREACYSEESIKLLMNRWEQARVVPPETTAATNAVEREVAEAAFTRPLDMARLESAIRARNHLRAQQTAQREEDSIALLRSLPPKDQAIYAADFSVMKPWPPAPPGSCPS